MSSQILLSGGDKWYSYSGIVFGDVTVPASISMVLIPNTGLRDSVIQIQPFFGKPVSSSGGAQLGISVNLDDVEVLNNQPHSAQNQNNGNENFTLFVPRQSKLEVISLNISGNNTQTRGCNIIGYYI